MFDLALALGEWDVDLMARRMPLRLNNEWAAYFREQPLPWKRDDMQAALMAMMFHNTIKGTFVKYPKMLRMKDLMLRFERPRRRPQTEKEIYQDLKMALGLSAG